MLVLEKKKMEEKKRVTVKMTHSAVFVAPHTSINATSRQRKKIPLSTVDTVSTLSTLLFIYLFIGIR